MGELIVGAWEGDEKLATRAAIGPIVRRTRCDPVMDMDLAVEGFARDEELVRLWWRGDARLGKSRRGFVLPLSGAKLRKYPLLDGTC